MFPFKRFFKSNSHNPIFKPLAGFGRALHRFYENRDHNIMFNGEYTVLKKLSRLHPQMIVDAGANIGRYCIPASQCCQDSKIYAFEPVADTFNSLQKNCLPFPNIIPVNSGLYHSKCTMQIHVPDSSTHASLLEGSHKNFVSELIHLQTGDDFFRMEEVDYIDFLKIDTEGSEMDVMKGFEGCLQQGKIGAIQFEYGEFNILSKVLLRDFYIYLKDFGYEIGKIYPQSVDFRKYEFRHEDFMGPNYLAVSKDRKDMIDIFGR